MCSVSNYHLCPIFHGVEVITKDSLNILTFCVLFSMELK
jgi:hypothetical protein